MRQIFLSLLLCATSPAFAMGLTLQPAQPFCGAAPTSTPLDVAPAPAAQRLAGSHLTRGSNDIAWAWLATPTLRYPHTALGSATHAASVQVQLRSDRILTYELPLHRVFEDLTPRLVDLDKDGKDELVLIESDALKGAALVVLGIKGERIVELARGPFAGSTFRWLNPVGFADFDADGQLDLAAVITPHIGGTLTLYRYRPPHLLAFASAMDVSNHKMGSTEQAMAVIVESSQQRPTIILPDMSMRALHALRWNAGGGWTELSDVKPLPAAVQRLTPAPNGACALLADQSWWRVTLHHSR